MHQTAGLGTVQQTSLARLLPSSAVPPGPKVGAGPETGATSAPTMTALTPGTTKAVTPHGVDGQRHALRGEIVDPHLCTPPPLHLNWENPPHVHLPHRVRTLLARP